MSVFQVNLHNFNTGPVDPNVNYDGFASATSNLPRTILLQGPNDSSRILHDGDQFTDSNYYKQFCYPQVALNDAFLTLISDDGSTYVKGVQSTYPKVYNIAAAGGSTYSTNGNSAKIGVDTGSYARFTQISNTGSGPVKIRLNGNVNAIMDLPSGHTQVFNAGDLSLTLIEVDNSASGAAAATVQIVVAIASGN